MPGPITRQTMFTNVDPRDIAYTLELTTLPGQLSPSYQQRVFDAAMAIMNLPLHRRAVYSARVDNALKVLAIRYGRTWNSWPSSALYLANNSNNNPNNSTNNNSNNNSYNHGRNAAPPPAALRAPNYSRASGYVKKWLSARPHTVYQNVVNIKLPANAADPISYKNFKSGNEAVMVIKKRLNKQGQMRSKRAFYEKNTIERMAGKKWRTILRMKGPAIVFKDPFNRRSVYRRDLMNVKFM